MKCLILAGGMSSRMRLSDNSQLDDHRSSLANRIAKGLLPVGKNETPFMVYLMTNALKAGITEFVILLNEKDQTSKHILNPFKHQFEMSFVTQSIPDNRQKPFGTADAVFQAMQQNKDLHRESFIVCNSDNLYSTTAFKLLISSHYANVMIAYDRDALQFPSEKISAFALSRFDQEFKLRSIIEKPSESEMKTFKDPHGKYRVSMNIFKFNGPEFYSFFETCPISEKRDEKEIPSAIMQYIKSGQPFYGIPLSEHVPDLTTKADLLRIEKEIQTDSIS